MPRAAGPGAKKHVCSFDGCGKAFTRSDHLQRHALNHSEVDSTCSRCSLVFKRPDLLERHMTRHRQKDEEAGAEGAGVVQTRKRLWRDIDGEIVHERPSTNATEQGDNQSRMRHYEDWQGDVAASQLLNLNMPIDAPLTPPSSFQSPESFDHVSQPLSEPCTDGADIGLGQDVGLGGDMFDFLANSTWGTCSSIGDQSIDFEGPMDNMFQADTASSFNMPFTTMDNYSWLFDKSRAMHAPSMQNISLAYGNQGEVVAEPDRQMYNNRFSHTPFQSRFAALPVPEVNDHLPMSDRLFQFQSPPDMSNDTMPMSAISGHTLQQRCAPSASDPLRSFTRTPTNTVGAFDHQRSPQRSLLLQTSQMAPSQPQSMSPPYKTDLPQKEFPSTPTIDEDSRRRVLDLLAIALPNMSEKIGIDLDSSLLSLPSMNSYLDLFFNRFNTVYPLLHKATFDPQITETLLLLAVMLLGATYSDKEVHKMAVCIHDILRAQIFQHHAFTAQPELWMLQTILLVECFGKSRAGQKQHDMAHLFHGLLINLIRRSDCQTVRKPQLSARPPDLEAAWRNSIDAELRLRLALLCFLWDTQHAVLFSQSLCMSSFELRTSMPCNEATWEASTAEDWWELAKKESQPSYLSVLRSYINVGSASQTPQLNALSRLLALHGIMSIQWDLKRRDQASLGSSPMDRSGQWQSRLAESYSAWKADFDSYCMNMMLSFQDPSKRAGFVRFSTSTNAIYYAAHIALNVEILDLQIYAGARHIIGRPVSRVDYDRSRRVIKEWAKPESSSSAAKTVGFAAQLLREGIMNLENWDCDSAFHYPWCLYISTLTCWAFHFANVVDTSPSSQDVTFSRSTQELSSAGMNSDDQLWTAKSSMNALVSSLASARPDTMWTMLKSKSTSGLTTIMAKHLANIRWAVIHEALKVLKGITA